MIRNDREYQITKAQAADFEIALTTLAEDLSAIVHPKIQKAQIDAVRSQLKDLHAEIAEYEALRDSRPTAMTVTSLEELPRALIAGRIAVGLTQSELAARLDVPEQQIQRNEATDYASANFTHLVEVANAVGVSISEDLLLPPTKVTERVLLRRLSDAGVDSDFVRRLLLNKHDDEEGLGAPPLIWAASAAQRIFGWTPNQVFAGHELLVPPHAAHAAMFKIYSAADERRTLFLAAFAEYVAKLVTRATATLGPQELPEDAATFRGLLVARSGSVDLKTALATLWDLGVVVVPLTERAGFHGACWRFDGRNVIVLKQRTPSEARWLHDLLHETYHAASRPETREFAWLDDETMPVDRRQDPEERRATRFAGDVQLGGRAEELARECVTRASKKVERLKAVVPQVAKAHGASVGALANYLAWRLTLDGVNWWGTAANLQEMGRPWKMVRDFLVARLDWSKLDGLDRQLLTRVLEERSQ
jgi:transcriptional regulator with XRE-family HTH domain